MLDQEITVGILRFWGYQQICTLFSHSNTKRFWLKLLKPNLLLLRIYSVQILVNVKSYFSHKWPDLSKVRWKELILIKPDNLFVSIGWLSSERRKYLKLCSYSTWKSGYSIWTLKIDCTIQIKVKDSFSRNNDYRSSFCQNCHSHPRRFININRFYWARDYSSLEGKFSWRFFIN